MANFCTKCGRQLSEGEVCNCTAATTPVTPVEPQPQFNAQQAQFNAQPQFNAQQAQFNGQFNAQQNAANETMNKAVKESTTSFLGLIKNPGENLKSYVAQGNWILALVMIALQAVIVTICSVAIEAKFAIALNSDYYKVVEFGDFVKAIFGTFVFSVIFSAALAGLLTLVNLIAKNKGNFFNALAAVSLKALATILFAFLAIIFAFINPVISGVLLVLTHIGGAVFVSNAMPTDSDMAKRWMPVLVWGAYFIYVAFMFIMMWLCKGILIPSGMLEILSYF